MGPQGRRPGEAAEPRAVAVAAPVAQAAPLLAEPVGSSSGAQEPAESPAAGVGAAGRPADTAAPADTGTGQAATAAVVAASRLAAAAAAAEPGSGSRPCRLWDTLRETGG
jgi:hypothetical protein